MSARRGGGGGGGRGPHRMNGAGRRPRDRRTEGHLEARARQPAMACCSARGETKRTAELKLGTSNGELQYWQWRPAEKELNSRRLVRSWGKNVAAESLQTSACDRFARRTERRRDGAAAAARFGRHSRKAAPWHRLGPSGCRLAHGRVSVEDTTRGGRSSARRSGRSSGKEGCGMAE
jgi:hypothetical protein